VKSHVEKYQKIQTYLEKECTHFQKLQININHFEETIDKMHDYILEKIEEAYYKGLF